jgi:hypothetical protein
MKDDFFNGLAFAVAIIPFVLIVLFCILSVISGKEQARWDEHVRQHHLDAVK